MVQYRELFYVAQWLVPTEYHRDVELPTCYACLSKLDSIAKVIEYQTSETIIGHDIVVAILPNLEILDSNLPRHSYDYSKAHHSIPTPPSPAS